MINDELIINGLEAEVEGKKILNGVDLSLKKGEIHIIMGPNGSGKSTLLNVLMGHPAYNVLNGEMNLLGHSLNEMPVDERARNGLFLAFQYPREVSGLTFGNFLRMAVNSVNKSKNPDFKSYSPLEFYKILQSELEKVKLNKSFIGRGVNEGFSGGEKKRTEIVQMALLKPAFALLDEIDSGLDVDALKVTAESIKRVFSENNMGLLLITHHEKILDYLEPDFVHIMARGRIVKSGDKALAKIIEKEGYNQFIQATND